MGAFNQSTYANFLMLFTYILIINLHKLYYLFPRSSCGARGNIVCSVAPSVGKVNDEGLNCQPVGALRFCATAERQLPFEGPHERAVEVTQRTPRRPSEFKAPGRNWGCQSRLRAGPKKGESMPLASYVSTQRWSEGDIPGLVGF